MVHKPTESGCKGWVEDQDGQKARL